MSVSGGIYWSWEDGGQGWMDGWMVGGVSVEGVYQRLRFRIFFRMGSEVVGR